MLATISPSNTHLDETLSTLRYACQARAIVNRARINESAHDRLIRELRSEVERLRALRMDYERRHSINSQSISFNESNGSNSSEMEEIKAKLSETETKLFEAQEVWEQRFMASRQKQLQELAEAEKYKAELESKVRILKTVSNDVSISPFKTNFLEELEGVLESDNKDNDLVDAIKSWCSNQGFICTFNRDKLKIVNPDNRRHAILSLGNVNLEGYENLGDFLSDLNWVDSCSNKGLSKAEIVNSMDQVYQILEGLQPGDGDNQLSLLYAKVSKTLQKFETALLSNVKQSKTVTFNLDT